MDYRSSLLNALAAAVNKVPQFEKQTATKVVQDVTAAASRGPIDAQTAAGIVDLLPASLLVNSKPVITLFGGQNSSLVPNPNQGVRSWLWSCTQFYPDTGVVVALNQVTIDPATNTSVWSIYAGGTHPATKKWVQSPTVYMDASAITIDAATGTTTVNVPNVVSASFVLTRGGTSVRVFFNATGFSLTANSQSAFQVQTGDRGPGDRMVEGLTKRTYFSYVDTVVTGGTFQPSSADPPTIFANTTGPAGLSWLDYQQLAVPSPTTVSRFLGSLRPQFPSMYTTSMWVKIQDPDNVTYIEAYVFGRGALQSLLDGNRVDAAASVWKGSANTRGVRDWTFDSSKAASIKVLSKYMLPKVKHGGSDPLLGGVPSKLMLYVDNSAYAVQGYSATMPLLVNTPSRTVVDSPSLVSRVSTGADYNTVILNSDVPTLSKGRGVLEWLVKHDSTADRRSAVQAVGLPAAYASVVTQPSTNAVLILVMILLALVFVVSLGCAIGLGEKVKREARQGGASASAGRPRSAGFSE